MSTRVQDLAAQALQLPFEDRAELVERLMASFEPGLVDQAVWLRLARLRRDEVRSGKVAMVPGGEALARVRARLAVPHSNAQASLVSRVAELMGKLEWNDAFDYKAERSRS